MDYSQYILSSYPRSTCTRAKNKEKNCAQNYNGLNRKSFLSSFVVNAYVLLLAIRLPGWNIKPGGHLDEKRKLIPMPGLSFTHLTLKTHMLHYKTYRHEIIVSIFCLQIHMMI
jgi:hypothetical protein